MRCFLQLGFALVMGMPILGTITASAAEAPTKAPSARGYAFRVNTGGLLLDENGNPVAVGNVSGYLDDLKLTGLSTVYLWLQGPGAAKTMGPTIEAFGGRFSTIVVKQAELGDKTGWLELPLSQKEPTRTHGVEPMPSKEPASIAAPTRQPEATNPQPLLVLSAGQTAILVAGQSARFPAGTTLCVPNGQNVKVFGQKNTVNATPGTIIAVPLNASGEADNIVIAP